MTTERLDIMNKLAKSKVILTALLGVSLTAGLLATPAKAVETINLTIWTFGEVIQPGLQRGRLHGAFQPAA